MALILVYFLEKLWSEDEIPAFVIPTNAPIGHDYRLQLQSLSVTPNLPFYVTPNGLLDRNSRLDETTKRSIQLSPNVFSIDNSSLKLTTTASEEGFDWRLSFTYTATRSFECVVYLGARVKQSRETIK